MKPHPLPPFSVIAGALRSTTERLTREIAQPRAEAPDWSAFEWAVARAVSAMHGISTLLETRLLWTGPEDWNAFLHDQYLQTLACHDHAGVVLARLERAGREANLPFIALKGSALREISLHHPGDRPMGDIDLLVRPQDMTRARGMIEAIGYRAAHAARRHLTFMPESGTEPRSFGEHVGNPLRIELHTRISEELPVDDVDITEDIWPAEVRPGNNHYRSFAALTRHVLLHVSGNMRANAMRFLQIYEIALLARRMSTSDWAELIGADQKDRAWWQYPAWSLAERYVPGSIPASILEQLASVCPRRLRRQCERWEVSDVSWSNLRIRALPGIEWARTLGEGLRFVRSRAVPTRTALAELHDSVVNSPSLGASTWYRSSQLRRIFAWTFGKPARVQTMASVSAALRAASS
jgi:hypothetical protein